MNGNEYQKLAMRTNDGRCTERMVCEIEKYTQIITNGIGVRIINDSHYDMGGIFNACLGLSGEVGELNDMVKKWVFHEKPLDIEHAKKELGDIMWYVAMMCNSFGWDLDEIMQMNIDKLIARYPEGFSPQQANNRREGDV